MTRSARWQVLRQQLTIAPTYIISSGHGVHAYFAFAQPLALDQWQPAAAALKRVCALAGLRADPSRTADAASILRPVGTHNRKTASAPKPVTVLKRGAVNDFAQFVKAVADLESQLRGEYWITRPGLLAGTVSDDDLTTGVADSIAGSMRSDPARSCASSRTRALRSQSNTGRSTTCGYHSSPLCAAWTTSMKALAWHCWRSILLGPPNGLQVDGTPIGFGRSFAPSMVPGLCGACSNLRRHTVGHIGSAVS